MNEDMSWEEAARQHTRYANGHRDELAKIGHRIYSRENRRKRKRPDSDWKPPVDAKEVRDHLNWLAENGLGCKTVSRLAGITATNIIFIRSGKTKRVSARNAEKLLAVSLNNRLRVPAAETMEKLLMLQEYGIGPERIGTLIGVPYQTLDSIRQGRRKTVLATTHNKVIKIQPYMFVEWRTLPYSERGKNCGIVSKYRIAAQAQ